ERDTVGLLELRLGRGAAISAEASDAGACDDAIALLDDLAGHVDNVHGAIAIEPDLIGLVVSADGGALTRFQIQPRNPVAINLAYVERAVWSDAEAVWVLRRSDRLDLSSGANGRQDATAEHEPQPRRHRQ